MDLTDALTLFKRLGVNVPSLSAGEFSRAYYRLAKRYHPDHGNNAGHDLMANINAARTTILKASPHSNWANPGPTHWTTELAHLHIA